MHHTANSARSPVLLAALLVSLYATTACASADNPAKDAAPTSAKQSDPPQQSTDSNSVFLPTDQVRGLSGITYLGGDRYLLASDLGGRVAQAVIRIHPHTGLIQSARIDSVFSIPGARDLEDIAYDPVDQTYLLADEATNTITRYTSHTQPGQSFAIPQVFRDARPNLGFESLAIDPVTRGVWTANEEALQNDGPRSTAEQGTVVRLQRFHRTGLPVAQFRYRTDPHAGSDNLVGQAMSGVSGLVALPNNHLIVMERALGGQFVPFITIKLYLVKPVANNDAQPAAQAPQELEKKLLLRFNAGLANYEGITLGPTLDNGDVALLLVSDDNANHAFPQRLRVFRLPASLLDAQPGGKIKSPGSPVGEDPAKP